MIYDIIWILLAGAAAVTVFYVSSRKHLLQEYLFHVMSEGVIFFDKNEAVRYFNLAAADLFPELEVKKRFDAWKHFTEYADRKHILLVREERRIRVDVKPVYVHGISVGYWAEASDCTQEEQYKEEILDLKKQVEEAGRAKAVFLAGMSYEIHTNMNAVLDAAQFLLQAPGLTETLKRNVMDIRRSSGRLLSMADHVLDLGKLESGTMEILPDSYRTRDFLQNMEKRMAAVLENSDVVFRMDIDPMLPSFLYGDVLRLYQIFDNLLINAVKYTDFGRIMLEIRCGDTGEKDESGRKKIILEAAVSDTGAGIKEELLPTLFEAFQHTETTRSSFEREGVHLGLSIVRQFVMLMGGSIEVKSVLGCGTVFRLWLPQGIEADTPIGEYCQGEYITEPQEPAEEPVLTAAAADEQKKIYQRGLSLFGGDTEQYLTLVRSVVEEGEELAIQLCRELSEDDFENYTLHMHTLKGITANIGAERFSAQAKELEMAGREGRFDDIREKHQQVLDAFYDLLGHMRAWTVCACPEEEGNEEQETPVLQDAQLLELLGQMKECLEDFYKDQAEALVRYCLSCRLDSVLHSGLCEIGSMIAGYEYDRPAQKAEELMEYIRNR